MKQITCPHCGDTYPELDVAHVCSRGPYAPKLKSNIKNERIRQLAEQATTYIEPTYSSGEGWIFDKEKFAELIVQECAIVIEQNLYKNIGWNTSRAVKRHFGIVGEEE